jgi:polar amino acid transport system substrate-binding protein
MRPGLAAALAFALSAGAAAAQQSTTPIPCGTLYAIQRGDTLHRIAVRAYGPDATYRSLWLHNRARLGRGDPSQIEVGQVIEVPCLGPDGAPSPVAAATDPQPTEPGAATSATPMVEGSAGAAKQASATTTPPRMAEVGPTAVDIDVSQASGIVARLAIAALQLELAPGAFRLAPEAGAPNAVRVGLVRPDCAAAKAQATCDGLIWSDPIAEAVAVWHGRRAPPVVARAADLAGLRLCRAAGAPETLIVAAGLRVSRVEARAVDCLRAVADAQADVSLSPAGEADAAMADAELAAALRELVPLTSVYDLRAAAPADDPRAAGAIEAMNAGLRRLRDSGTWFAALDAALAGEDFTLR